MPHKPMHDQRATDNSKAQWERLISEKRAWAAGEGGSAQAQLEARASCVAPTRSFREMSKVWKIAPRHCKESITRKHALRCGVSHTTSWLCHAQMRGAHSPWCHSQYTRE